MTNFLIHLKEKEYIVKLGVILPFHTLIFFSFVLNDIRIVALFLLQSCGLSLSALCTISML